MAELICVSPRLQGSFLQLSTGSGRQPNPAQPRATWRDTTLTTVTNDISALTSVSSKPGFMKDLPGCLNANAKRRSYCRVSPTNLHCGIWVVMSCPWWADSRIIDFFICSLSHILICDRLPNPSSPVEQFVFSIFLFSFIMWKILWWWPETLSLRLCVTRLERCVKIFPSTMFTGLIQQRQASSLLLPPLLLFSHWCSHVNFFQSVHVAHTNMHRFCLPLRGYY